MAVTSPSTPTQSTGNPWSSMSPRARLFTGLAVFIVFCVVVLAIWGAHTAFPFKIGNDIADAIDTAIKWFRRTFEFILEPLSDGVLRFLLLIKDFFLWLPWPIVLVGVALAALKTAGRGVAIFSLAALLGMGVLNLWTSAMETLALILVSVLLSIIIAVPTGIVAARSRIVDAILRPILDAMQTMPAFVYLVPAVIFFGIGDVPAIFATIIYAVPPAIRLTSLGIRQVSADTVEAALSFGTTSRQLLFKVQIPMAVPTIMAGVNQTVMMALAMVVIASLVGAGGLGEDVNRALNRAEPGQAFLSGLGIVFLAIITDRITQAWAKERQKALMGDQH